MKIDNNAGDSICISLFFGLFVSLKLMSVSE